MPEITVTGFSNENRTFNGSIGSPVLVFKDGHWEVAAVMCNHIISQMVRKNTVLLTETPIRGSFKSTGIFRPVTRQFIEQTYLPTLADLQDRGLDRSQTKAQMADAVFAGEME
ncbi:MAG TPA: hypothetical protein PLV25_06780, partial [Opitutales bacterium]|nr:hypothetical protein [Opitutales bacterium]